MSRLPRAAAAAGAVTAALAGALAAAPAAAGVLASSLPPAATAAIDRELGGWIAADEPGGALLLVRSGAPVLRAVYGLANVELEVATNADQVFQIGSLTKQFTATAVLLLVDEGKLRLETPIGALLPGFPPQAQGITVEHLLGHTSGLVNVANLPEWAASWGRETQPDQLIDLFRRRPLADLPGTEFEYNNSGYIALGRMIELASGQSYADFVRTRIFEPLGMARSSYNDWLAVVPGRVSGYAKTAGGWQNVRAALHPSQLYAAGALLSTVDDFARFQAALAGGRLISKPLLERMTRPGRLNDGLATGYGFGWAVSVQRGKRVLEHGGASNGFYGAVVWLPDDDLWGVVLTNRYGFGDRARELLAAAAKTAAGWPARETPAAVAAAALARLEGLYRSPRAPSEWIEIRSAGDHLVTRRPEGERLEAWPRSETEFFRVDRPERLRFEPAAAGEAPALLTVVPYKGERRWVRSAQPLAPEPEPTPAPAAAVADPSIYVGHYLLGPGLPAEIGIENGNLVVTALGYQKVALTPVGEHQFTLPVAFGTIRFVVEGGRATAVVFTQGGQEMPGRRID